MPKTPQLHDGETRPYPIVRPGKQVVEVRGLTERSLAGSGTAPVIRAPMLEEPPSIPLAEAIMISYPAILDGAELDSLAEDIREYATASGGKICK
jgi:hypothetical protein